MRYVFILVLAFLAVVGCSADASLGANTGGQGSESPFAPCCAELEGPLACWCRLEHLRTDCTQAWWDAEYPDSTVRRPKLVSDCPAPVPVAPEVWCCRRSPLDWTKPAELNYCSCTLEASEVCDAELAAVTYAERVPDCP